MENGVSVRSEWASERRNDIDEDRVARRNPPQRFRSWPGRFQRLDSPNVVTAEFVEKAARLGIARLRRGSEALYNPWVLRGKVGGGSSRAVLPRAGLKANTSRASQAPTLYHAGVFILVDPRRTIIVARWRARDFRTCNLARRRSEVYMWWNAGRRQIPACRPSRQIAADKVLESPAFGNRPGQLRSAGGGFLRATGPHRCRSCVGGHSGSDEHTILMPDLHWLDRMCGPECAAPSWRGGVRGLARDLDDAGKSLDLRVSFPITFRAVGPDDGLTPGPSPSMVVENKPSEPGLCVINEGLGKGDAVWRQRRQGAGSAA